jgi:hypothetical protein
VETKHSPEASARRATGHRPMLSKGSKEVDGVEVEVDEEAMAVRGGELELELRNKLRLN